MEKLRNLFSILMKPTHAQQDSDSTVSLNSYRELRHDSLERSPFVMLPTEIQSKIFNELSSLDMKRSRLVCTRWRKIIDSTCHFAVIIDDKLFDYNDVSFPKWKIAKCFIRNLREQNVVSVNLLHFPETLRKLTIWGCVLPSNFIFILKSAENLEELDLANKALTYGENCLWETDGKIERVPFNNLRKLTVFSADAMKSIYQNLLGLFEQSMPNLMKINISVDDRLNGDDPYPIPSGMVQNEMKVAAALVQFIASHQNLKTVQVTVNPYIHVKPEDLQIWMNKLNAATNYEEKLGRLKLQNLRLNVAPFYMQLLRRIVKSQETLKDIRLHVPFWGHLPLQYSSIENSIRCSIKTLVSIQLEWLAGFSTRPVVSINFNLFTEAKRLKRLAMKRWWCGSLNENGMATIVNLPHLPKTLQDLAIEGFQCITEELTILAEATDTIPNLNYVRFSHVGCRPGFGIDGAVAKAFCSRQSLNQIVLGPLRNRVIGTEDSEYPELRSIYENDLFRSGQLITFDFVKYRRRLQLKEAEETRRNDGRILSCFS